MFSKTTIELSTTIPTEKASPARLITFKVRPNQYSIKKAPMTLMGMATDITSVEEPLRK